MPAAADVAVGTPFPSIAMTADAASSRLMAIDRARLRAEADAWVRTVAGRDAMIAALRFDPPVRRRRKGLSLGGFFASRGADADGRPSLDPMFASGLFLPGWYAHTQAVTIRDAPAHFAEIGMARGAAPNPFFDPQWYRCRYLVGENEPAILHYLRIGACYALAPGPLFDPLAYMVRYPKVANVPDLLAEFLRHGLAKGHVATPLGAPKE